MMIGSTHNKLDIRNIFCDNEFYIMKKLFMISMLVFISMSLAQGWESDKRKNVTSSKSDKSSSPVKLKLSDTPTSKEEIRITVEVLQVIFTKDAEDAVSNEGLLCITSNGIIYVEYTGDDVANGDILQIGVKRNGVYRYQSKGEGLKAIGKYEWKPRDGQKQIFKEDQRVQQIEGKVIVVYVDKDEIRAINQQTARAYIIKGYKDIANVIDGESITVKAKRAGAISFRNENNETNTLPVYKCVDDLK